MNEHVKDVDIGALLKPGFRRRGVWAGNASARICGR